MLMMKMPMNCLKMMTMILSHQVMMMVHVHTKLYMYNYFVDKFALLAAVLAEMDSSHGKIYLIKYSVCALI